jgi:transcriptional regulator of arginine metabolism
MTWKNHLLDIVRSGDFRTQGELVGALHDDGFEVHQGSVSRELRSRGVTKVAGVYVVPDVHFGAPIHSISITANGCMVVLLTDPAFAPVVAQSVDDVQIDGVLGTIAGDNTVFIATTGVTASQTLAEHFDMASSQ